MCNADGYAGYLAGVRDTYSYNAARNADTRTTYHLPDDVPVDLPNPESVALAQHGARRAAAAALIALGLVVNLFRGFTEEARR